MVVVAYKRSAAPAPDRNRAVVLKLSMHSVDESLFACRNLQQTRTTKCQRRQKTGRHEARNFIMVEDNSGLFAKDPVQRKWEGKDSVNGTNI